MMKNLPILLILTIFTLLPHILMSADTHHDMEKAKQMDLFLKKIAEDSRPRVFLRRKSVDQSTVNSYLSLIYLPRYAREVKEAQLSFHKDNWVSGRISIRLAGEKYRHLPGFLKEMDLEMSGIIESRPEQMRFQIKELKLNSTTFSPEILDEAFSTFQGGNKVKRSIFDWFTLLPGIKRISSDEGSLTIFY